MTMQVVRAVALLSLASWQLRAQDFHEFRSSGLLPEVQADVRAVAAGDLDGDGDADLLFGCFGEAGVGQRNYWLRNDGTGLFSVTGPGWVALAPSLTRAVALGDFDQDGDLDALFGNQRLDSLCRNDGTGRLSLAVGALPPVDRETNALAVGDLDGDGDLDAVAACNGFNTIYRNDGTGVFSDASAGLPQVWQDCSDVALADLDGDGDLDLLFGGSTAQLLWNDGLGNFTPASLVLPGGRTVECGDVDGDGDQDFVVAAIGVPWLSVALARLYRNDGPAGFVWSEFAAPPGLWVLQGDLIDFEGDGDLDLVSNVGLLRNDGTGTFVWASAEPRAGGLFTDLDGDADADLVVGPRAFRNHDGVIQVPRGDLELRPSETVHELVDFDQDGDLDAVVVGAGHLEVLANDGRGRFAEVLVQRSLQAWGIGSMAAADWTGDGFPDLLDLASFGDQLLVSQGGHGLIAQPLPVPLVYGFVTADFDHDGDLDLAVSTPNGAFVLRNSGTGSFTTTAGLPLGFQATFDDVADFDADGQVDLLVHLSGQTPGIWRGNGTGGFAVMGGSLPAGLTEVRCGRAHDFDGDGDVDIALGHGSSAQAGPRVTMLTNDGSGHFVVAANLPMQSEVQAIAAADIDEDGDLDVVVTGNMYGGEPSRLWRNDGGMVFTDITFPGIQWRGLPAVGGSMVQFGDVDGDADVDVVATSPHGAQLLRNLRRQTHTWPLPVVGANWRVEVYMRPVEGTAVGMLIGLLELSPGLATPFGLLRVDPAAAVGFGFFPTQGFGAAAGVTLSIPPDPALRGVRLFAQGISLASGELRLANQTVDIVR